MLGDNIIYDAQRQIFLNLKQRPGINSKTRYYARSSYLLVLKRSEKNLHWKPGESVVFRYSRAANSVVSYGI